MSQATCDHITSFARAENSIHASKKNASNCLKTPLSACDPDHPDAVLFAAWRGYAEAVRKFGALDISKITRQDEDEHCEETAAHNKIIRNTEAKTADGIDIKLRHALAQAILHYMPDGYLCEMVCDTLTNEQISNLMAEEATRLPWNILQDFCRLREAPCDAIDRDITDKKSKIPHADIDDKSRDLDCAIVDMEAGIGVLTALADGCCNAGEDISGESITWIAAKLGADVRRLSATIEAYQAAARR